MMGGDRILSNEQSTVSLRTKIVCQDPKASGLCYIRIELPFMHDMEIGRQWNSRKETWIELMLHANATTHFLLNHS